LSTKIHLAVDGRGRPLSIVLTPGQAGDNPQLLTVLDRIRVHRAGRGRPRKRPDMVIADKAYAHDSTARRYAGVGSGTPCRSASTRSCARCASITSVLTSLVWHG
jgi:transposase